jgi:hypothetical protein
VLIVWSARSECLARRPTASAGRHTSLLLTLTLMSILHIRQAATGTAPGVSRASHCRLKLAVRSSCLQSLTLAHVRGCPGLPFDLFTAGSSLGLVSVMKATRLLRLRRFLALLAGKGVKLASAVAMVRLFFSIILLSHLLACIWCVPSPMSRAQQPAPPSMRTTSDSLLSSCSAVIGRSPT